jgi:hypothetical protein
MSSLKTHTARLSSHVAALDNLIFFIIGLIISLMIRIRLFPILVGDYYFFLSPWYDYIRDHGGFRALKDNFAN